MLVGCQEKPYIDAPGNVNLSQTEYETTGDGTLQNPYTVSDLIGLKKRINGKNVWFQGVVVGSINASELEQKDCQDDTNLAVGDQMEGATAGTSVCVKLPLALIGPKATNWYELAPAYEPTNIGKTIRVKGTISREGDMVVELFDEIRFNGKIYTQTEEPKNE